MARKSQSTVVEIAQALNVAHSTVSRALKDSPLISDATKRKVWDLAEKMNYKRNPFANGLRTGQTKIIELQYYTRAEHLRQDPILLTVLDMCQFELQKRGYHLLLNIVRDRKKKSTRKTFNAHMADGHLIVSNKKIPASVREDLDADSSIVLDNKLPKFSTINFDIEESLERVFLSLIQKKRRRILCLLHDPKGKFSLEQRVLTYQKLCHKYSQDITNMGTLSVDSNDPALNNVLRDSRKIPDALICFSEELIDKTITIAERENLRISDDLNIVGIIDDAGGALRFKNITYILLDWPELARQAAIMLLAILQEEIHPPIRHVVKGVLYERE